MSNPTKFTVERHDLSSDKSLQAWSAADEYLLQYAHSATKSSEHIAVYNDRFGYLTCHLEAANTTTILTAKSQEKAVLANMAANQLTKPTFANPLTPMETKADLALIKMPKSHELFQLFLEHIVVNSTKDSSVVCAFMTKHFSPRIIEIASKYYNEVSQTKAQKKARLLTLKGKKEKEVSTITRNIHFSNQDYKQYAGVFSANHIDYATQFFLEHLIVREEDQRILDLASGNGVIANEILKNHPDKEMHLIDDAYLAVASAKLNCDAKNVHHHWDNNLESFSDNSFDLIVSNPPFHFEYEVNIQITLALFKECLRCLNKGGHLQVVANKHLNYMVHLKPLFATVNVIAEDKKYIVYQCVK